MEKEIKVRKKRFAAFWLMLALVCSLVVPMAVSAQDYSVDDTSLSGQTLVAGDTMTYTSSDGTTATYSIYYKSSDGKTTYYTDSASYNAKYAVLDITDSKLSAITPQEGSTFAGWDVDEVYISSGILYSVTLKARFTPNTYPISYELNGGENATSNPTSYTYGTGVASFANASKEGHDFDGWYSDTGFTTKAESIDTEQIGVVTLYAKFTPKTYSITYEPYGGAHTNTVSSYTYGVGIDSFAPATKEGYNFEGWYRDADFMTKVESITATDTGNLNLYAKFTRSITYVLNGGTNADSNPASYVEGIGANLAAASKPGFVFAGWYTDKEFTTKIESIGTDVTGNLELYAKFDIGAIGPYTYDLKKGVQYQLGSATKVSGDNSTYVSGSTFYVPEDGSYTFS